MAAVTHAWLQSERRRLVAALQAAKAPPTTNELATLANVQACIAAFEAEARS